MADTIHNRVRTAIRDVPDFPKPGILFKDITPLLADPRLLADVMVAMTSPFCDYKVTHVVAIESRGFLFGPSVALSLGAALIPVRKAGKLPWRTAREAYALEYGESAIEVHEDAFHGTSRVLIVDDILATGGTAAATARLVQRLGGTIVGASFLGEISFLHGRRLLGDIPVQSVIQF